MAVLASKMENNNKWNKTFWKESYDEKIDLLNKQLDIVSVKHLIQSLCLN